MCGRCRRRNFRREISFRRTRLWPNALLFPAARRLFVFLSASFLRKYSRGDDFQDATLAFKQRTPAACFHRSKNPSILGADAPGVKSGSHHMAIGHSFAVTDDDVTIAIPDRGKEGSWKRKISCSYL